VIITNWRVSYEDRRGFDHFNPGVYQHDPDLVPAQYRTSMDQSTISNASENRNDPIHQRRSPRYPRIPCKLWIRGDLQHDQPLKDTLGVIFGFIVMTLFDNLLSG